MGVIQNSINQSLSSIAGMIGLGKGIKGLKEIKEDISTPEQRAQKQAEANAIQQRADWEQELSGINKQMKALEKGTKNFREEINNLGPLYVEDEQGNILKDAFGQRMLSPEVDDFINKYDLHYRDYNDLLDKKRDLTAKLNKSSQYSKSLSESGKMITNQATFQAMVSAFREGNGQLINNLKQRAAVKKLHTELKENKDKGGTENG